MGRFTRAPVYLSDISQFDKKQMRAINDMLKSYYNELQSKGFQKQLKDEINAESVIEVGGRVADLKSYLLNDIMYAYFTFNPNFLQKNTEDTFLFSIEIPEGKQIVDVRGEGYESDSMVTSISLNGYFGANGNEIFFRKTGDFEGNLIFKIQLMVFLADKE